MMGHPRSYRVTELKPKRTSFLFTRVVGALITSTFVLVGAVVAGLAAELPVLAAGGAGLSVFMLLLSIWSANVAWTKERYEIHEGHLVAHAGGITSDRTTELDIKNITHVKQRLPWIRYRFFDVGDVVVQSAGSSSAEVVFEAVRDPDAVYEQVRELMRANGFALRGERLLHSEQPSTIGVIVECISRSAGAVFFLLWAGGGVAGAGAALGPAAMAAAAAAAALLGLGAVAFLGLHFVDMKQRTYEVYDDVVEYREGFLSRTNAFIPYENIADASTKQTFVDQMLGLYDVKVSCQGSGSEVAFRRLANGPALQAVLRGRVDGAQELRERQREQARVEQSQAAEVAAAGSAGSATRSSRPPAEVVPASEAWTAELRMNSTRAFFGGAIIRALGTTYTVGPSSVASRFSLLGQQQLEFAYDKVTGVKVMTSPWDSVFGTFSVRIWSIGSSTPLTLAHVDRDAVDLPALLRQAGIPGGPARETLEAAFEPMVWLRAHVIGAVISVILFPFAVLALMNYPLLAMRYKRQRLTFHDHHMEHRSGIFWRSHVYARYDDIKKVSTRRYAGTDQGSLTVFVAGETQLQGKNGKGGAVIPNSFTAHYLADVTPLTQTLDPLLQGHITPSEVLRGGGEPAGAEFKAAPANSVVTMAIVGVFFPPLWLFIPWVVIAVKRRIYRVEAERAVIETGVIYRTHTSVLFDRIDSLEQGQGMLGKAFDNGSVTLYTAGSSRPDLMLTNTPGYPALYKAIRERYGG